MTTNNLKTKKRQFYTREILSDARKCRHAFYKNQLSNKDEGMISMVRKKYFYNSLLLTLSNVGIRGSWKLGRITYLNTSIDNLIRSVKLRLSYGKIVRPISLLYPVEING